MASIQPDPDSDPVAWRRIAGTLRAQIRAGELAPGEPAPSITALVQKHGNARATCGKALQALAGEGLLIRYPGLGYYVAGAGINQE